MRTEAHTPKRSSLVIFAALSIAVWMSTTAGCGGGGGGGGNPPDVSGSWHAAAPSEFDCLENTCPDLFTCTHQSCTFEVEQDGAFVTVPEEACGPATTMMGSVDDVGNILVTGNLDQRQGCGSVGTITFAWNGTDETSTLTTTLDLIMDASCPGGVRRCVVTDDGPFEYGVSVAAPAPVSRRTPGGLLSIWNR